MTVQSQVPTTDREMTVARIILQQLRTMQTQRELMCWGARDYMDVGDGLKFRVSGLHFKGWVIIKLSGDDLYNVEFGTVNLRQGEWKVRHQMSGAYGDQLVAWIDGFVERGER